MSGEAGGKRQGDVFRPGDVDLVGAGQAGGLWLPWEAVTNTGFGTCTGDPVSWLTTSYGHLSFGKSTSPGLWIKGHQMKF